MPIVNASNDIRRAVCHFVIAVCFVELSISFVNAQQLITFTPNSTARPTVNTSAVSQSAHRSPIRSLRRAGTTAGPTDGAARSHERRWVPHWVIESQRTTQTQYVHYVTISRRCKSLIDGIVCAATSQLDLHTVTQYQAVDQVVDQPVQFQNISSKTSKWSYLSWYKLLKLVNALSTSSAGPSSPETLPTPTTTTNASPLAPLPNALQNSGALAMSIIATPDVELQLASDDSLYRPPEPAIRTHPMHQWRPFQ